MKISNTTEAYIWCVLGIIAFPFIRFAVFIASLFKKEKD